MVLKRTRQLSSHYRVLPLRASVFVGGLALHLKKKVKAILTAKIVKSGYTCKGIL